jgi:hypothetical protein
MMTDNFYFFDMDYYQNDHLFGEYLFSDSNSNTSSIFKGSYLFDFGLFVGLNYVSESRNQGSAYVISPGYRFNLRDKGYLAFSVDYGSWRDEDIDGIGGYDLDFKYYPDRFKIAAQYYHPTQNNLGGDDLKDIYELEVDYQVNPELTVGFSNQISEGESLWFAGLSWTTKLLILDLKTGNSTLNDDFMGFEGGFFEISGLFKFLGVIAFGLDYFSAEEKANPRTAIKYLYDDEPYRILVGYVLPNDDYRGQIIFQYQYRF